MMKKLLQRGDAENTSVSVLDSSTMLQDAVELSGFEGMTASDFMVPFLSLVQRNSPQLDDESGKYIAGAKSGHVFNSVNSQLYTDGIHVVPCGYRKVVCVWRPDRGGLVGHLAPGSKAAEPVGTSASGHPINAEGNELVDTAYHYVLLVEQNGSSKQAVISMSSTQLKKSRAWNNLMADTKIDAGGGIFKRAPMYSHIYFMSSVSEENAQGSWKNWKIDPEAMIEDVELYQAARKFAKSVSEGIVTVQTPGTEKDSSDKVDEEVPF